MGGTGTAAFATWTGGASTLAVAFLSVGLSIGTGGAAKAAVAASGSSSASPRSPPQAPRRKLLRIAADLCKAFMPTSFV
jgi:hypothetical protein